MLTFCWETRSLWVLVVSEAWCETLFYFDMRNGLLTLAYLFFHFKMVMVSPRLNCKVMDVYLHTFIYIYDLISLHRGKFVGFEREI